MYPWYRGSAASDFDLRPDDIDGIQALYGKSHQVTFFRCSFFPTWKYIAIFNTSKLTLLELL